MAVANSTAPTRRTRSTPKNSPKPSTPEPGVIEHLEPDVHRLVNRALVALERSAVYRAAPLSSPALVRSHLKLRLAHLDHEEIVALWLDTHHRLIASITHAVGTLAQASVYPREIARTGLRLNAAAVILAHNHPSGNTEPSRADVLLTEGVKDALQAVDIRLVDHFIVGGTADPLSFAERGLL